MIKVHLPRCKSCGCEMQIGWGVEGQPKEWTDYCLGCCGPKKNTVEELGEKG